MKKINLAILCFLLFNISFSQVYKKLVENELIVKFKLSEKPNYKTSIIHQKFDNPVVDALNKKNKIQSIRLTGNKKQGDTYILKFDSNKKISDISEFYRNTELFEYVEPNFIGKGHGIQTTPNDNSYHRQWSHYNDGTFSLSSSSNDADIDTDLAWSITQGSSNLVVAIFDTGLKLDHPEFSGRIWSNSDETGNGFDTDSNGYIDDIGGGWDFVNNDSDPTDDHGHGTNVAGIALASGNNSIGYAGVNWNSKIMVCKILDNNNNGYYSWWAEAIYYAVDNGAAVINMSAGGNDASTLLQDAINYAFNNNVAMVVSTGNQNSSIQYPAKYTNVFAIGSTNPNDTRSVPFFWSSTSGSNYGPELDFVAPGNYIYGLSHSSDTFFNSYWGGTSQAAPHVTGLISLLLSVNSNLTVTQIRTILEESSEDQVGDFQDTEGWDQYYGHGRINAYQALTGCSYPTTQTTSFTSSSITNNSMTVGWTRGNGDKILIVARADEAVTADPTDGVSYTANAAFASGEEIGTGNYVVYDGTGTSVDLTALSSVTDYYYAIYEYTSATYCYLLTALTGNASTTCSYPTTQATSFTSSSITNNSMTVGWIRGNGDKILIVARASEAVTADPTDGVSYTANAAFASGEEIGTGNYVVHDGTGTSVDLTALSSVTDYYYAIYEYTSATYCYLLTALTGNASTAGTTPALTVSPSNHDVAEAGSANFEISSNTSWTATDNADWLTLLVSSGSNDATLTATFTENTSTASRIATITLSGTGVSSVTATVTQAGKTPALTVSPSNRDVNYNSGTTTFDISSNINWTATDNADWLTLLVSSGSNDATLTATFTENTSTASRTATITLSGTGVSSVTATVTQAGITPALTVSPSNQDVGAEAGSTTFEISSNTSWAVSDDTDWLTLSSESGSANATLTATYSENSGIFSRTATITITGSGIDPKTVTVIQTGAEAVLTVTPSNQDVGSEPGAITFDIVSNITWTVSDDADWLTFSSSSGSNNATLTATYTENTSTSSRTATITVSGTGVNNVTVTVTQSGGTPVLSVSPDNRNVEKEFGSTTFDISSNINWAASDDADWLTLSSSSGSNDATLNITCEENLTYSARVANISISGSGLSAQVTVTQNINVGIEESAFSKNIIVYPNPAANLITVELKDINIEIKKLYLIDMKGNVVHMVENNELKSNNIRIDVSKLYNGIYYIYIMSDKGFVIRKLSIVK